VWIKKNEFDMHITICLLNAIKTKHPDLKLIKPKPGYEKKYFDLPSLARYFGVKLIKPPYPDDLTRHKGEIRQLPVLLKVKQLKGTSFYSLIVRMVNRPSMVGVVNYVEGNHVYDYTARDLNDILYEYGSNLEYFYIKIDKVPSYLISKSARPKEEKPPIFFVTKKPAVKKVRKKTACKKPAVVKITPILEEDSILEKWINPYKYKQIKPEPWYTKFIYHEPEKESNPPIWGEGVLDNILLNEYQDVQSYSFIDEKPPFFTGPRTLSKMIRGPQDDIYKSIAPILPEYYSKRRLMKHRGWSKKAILYFLGSKPDFIVDDDAFGYIEYYNKWYVWEIEETESFIRWEQLKSSYWKWEDKEDIMTNPDKEIINKLLDKYGVDMIFDKILNYEEKNKSKTLQESKIKTS